MRTGIPARLACACIALLLCACTGFAPGNPPLALYQPGAGYRFETLAQEDNPDELFVIVSFSGGGTRAAALAYGVLEALRDTRISWHGHRKALLDEVDVIASISGGSFPAAYYALHGAKIFDEFPQRFLYRPVQSELLHRALSPASWPKLASPDYGRSDLAAQYYDREVFGGATYAEVIANQRRPFVVLNATDMSSGAQFPFIQDQFDLLCSDLAGVTLARAVASSSAFPGGLTALTFRNYAGSCGYRQPSWVQLAAEDHALRANRARSARAQNRLSLAATEPDAEPTAPPRPLRPYIHLTDGGVADNIGLRGPLDAIGSVNHPWSVLRLMNNRSIAKLAVIVVNAATHPPSGRDQSARVPGLIDTLKTAADVPLDNYSADTLDLLAAAVNQFNEEARLLEACARIAGTRCAPDGGAPHRVELYPVEVAFDYIAAEEDRAWFKNLPTSLELPRESVDRLRSVGRRLLAEDPKFQALLKTLQGCLPALGATC